MGSAAAATNSLLDMKPVWLLFPKDGFNIGIEIHRLRVH